MNVVWKMGDGSDVVLEYLLTLPYFNFEELFNEAMDMLLDAGRYEGVKLLLDHPEFKAEYLHQDAPYNLSHELLTQNYENEYGYNEDNDNDNHANSIGALALRYLMEPDTIGLAYRILTTGELYHELKHKYFRSRLKYLEEYIKDNRLPPIEF